ncbi:hypothetical protein Pfo_027099 [Paulownia fortunei]|nr:hypothetical protein Pfo_027099 [Paulownia fortunei]
MAKLLILCSKTLKSIICLLLLAISLASSARTLQEISPQIPVPIGVPDISDPIAPPETDIPDAAQPAAATATTTTTTTTPTTNVVPIPDPSTPAEPAPVIAPVPDIPNTEAPPLTTSVPPVTTPAATTTPSGGAATTATAASTNPTTAGTNAIPDHPTLSFFMHDILGGSNPSGRVVTGIVANSDANNLPFSKPNNPIFPINGGVPLNTINGVINNNNFPFLVGLNGSPTNTLIQNNGNNVVTGNNNQAFVTAGQLPAGLTLQQLMFGSVTVVDNEITEGHELGSSVLGKAQGFYLTSSSDGSSHTLALTALFHGGDHEILDTVSFFGVHRTATPISHIAIVGGTGKYENAKGYATIETLPHQDQHTTDGLETITHFTVYLTP